ncbi:hypothetical protein NP233_g2467 [Leucocoprinus birnbaumii]|uniref:Uncharacterized protein n=1 Tax=Leucocoprinus birnbaumii TaxID=56174 RepID=A0AAD5VYX6_9AGAR|nr:hypothetical protein NP233_g2467 [Leucocoprinus birnbaumii]
MWPFPSAHPSLPQCSAGYCSKPLSITLLTIISVYALCNAAADIGVVNPVANVLDTPVIAVALDQAEIPLPITSPSMKPLSGSLVGELG